MPTPIVLATPMVVRTAAVRAAAVGAARSQVAEDRRCEPVHGDRAEDAVTGASRW